jgi:hypothetical protein
MALPYPVSGMLRNLVRAEAQRTLSYKYSHGGAEIFWSSLRPNAGRAAALKSLCALCAQKNH